MRNAAKTGANWQDLRARVLSAIVMVVVGGAAVWLGGVWMQLLCIIAAGLMLWELATMMGCGKRSIGLAGVAALLEAAAVFHPNLLTLASLGLVPAVGAFLVKRDQLVFFAYGLAVLVVPHVLVSFRAALGPIWIGWLILVVAVTDIAGYFAGRAIGGPKFWPSISPKKTWSGTVAGWIGAALVGAAFAYWTTAGPELVLISAVAALASQLGDIAESAIKRRMGAKDSSHLIPGHGGLLDRFDGLIGATLMMVLITEIIFVPIMGL